MKYTGRIYTVIVALVAIVIMRVYGTLYYNFPAWKFPFLGLIVIIVYWWLGKKYDQVKLLSEKDVLTKVYNRRYVTRTFPKLSVLMDKKEEKLSLFLIDVDDFKRINDTYGHKLGDTVLQQLAIILSRNTGKRDIVARWSGDEFLIIAPFTNEIGKEIIITHINNELHKFSDELNIHISVSIGTAQYPNDAKSLDGLLVIADEDMYKLKFQKKTNLS
ncbi:MAG TPA: GGDEF domain-containing protein [Bacilli bacterium]